MPTWLHPQNELSALKASSQAAVAAAQAQVADLQLAVEGRDDTVTAARQSLSEAQARIATLQEERLASVEIDAAAEIRSLTADVDAKTAALRAAESALAEARTAAKQTESRAAGLQARVDALSSAMASQDSESASAQTTASAEIARLQEQLAQSAAAQHAAAAQEKAVAALQAQLTAANASVSKLRKEQRAAGSRRGGGAGGATASTSDTADTRKLQKDLDKAQREIEKLSQRLEASGGKGGGGGGGVELQKMEKKLRDADKRVAAYKAQDAKHKEKTAALTAAVAEKEKAVATAQGDARALRQELKAAEASAAESLAVMDEYKSLKVETKKLRKQNEVLQENFNTERVLRKKYYNMMEDMKGKVRVYCRVRPLSGTEKERGNHIVVSAPDEYSLVVSDGNRHEEFGFDSVFMPDGSQEQVYEDTGNLIQSAVDGFNVCIFAYGQTGTCSGMREDSGFGGGEKRKWRVGCVRK